MFFPLFFPLTLQEGKNPLRTDPMLEESPQQLKNWLRRNTLWFMKQFCSLWTKR